MSMASITPAQMSASGVGNWNSRIPFSMEIPWEWEWTREAQFRSGSGNCFMGMGMGGNVN